MSFENVFIWKVADPGLAKYYYQGMEQPLPTVPYQEPYDGDSESTEYNVKGRYPETGFIIQKPSQPQTPGSFALAITEDQP